MNLSEYQDLVTTEEHSMDPNRACCLCGDIDGCHLPAQIRRKELAMPQADQQASLSDQESLNSLSGL